MNFIDFTGKKILVAGASSGIGRATTILLSQLGASLVLVSRNVEKLNSVIGECDNPERHISIALDISDTNSYKEVFDCAIKDGIKLSGLVYSVGEAKPVPLRVITPEEYDRVFRINYFGFLYMTEFYAKKKYNDGGSIVGISAINMHYPQKCMTLYSSAKAALETTVRTLALELSNTGIRINAVIPGAVDTPMSETINPETLEKIVSSQLLGFEKPEDIANMIVFLLSKRSRAVTGRSIYADGGRLGQ